MIKHYRFKKKYGRKKLLKEFPKKNWSEIRLRILLNKIDDTGDTKRKQGSGRPRTSRSNVNIDTVENLILSQENDPSAHLSLREFEMETGIPRASVHLVVKFDLGLTAFKLTNVQRLTREDEKKRIERGKRLLRYMTLANLEKTFRDEKIFKLQAPDNKQIDRIYGVNLSDIREEGNSEKRKFPVSVMVSAGVSVLEKTSIHFVTPGAKLNSAYYCLKVCHNYCQRWSSYQMVTISSNKMELVRTHKKLHLLTQRSIAVSFCSQIFGHLIALTSVLVIILSGVHWKPKSGSIIDFRSELLKI